MKRKILIVLLCIILVALAVIGYFVFTDMQQESKLRTELFELYELSNAENIDIDEINNRLDRITTKGEYAKVEDAFKSYLRENFNNSIQIAEILNDNRITTLLSVENYKEDGKDFIESKKYITTTKAELENCKTKYKEFFTEEKAMSYINNKELDSYYIDLYKQKLIGDIEDGAENNVVESSIDEVISILNTTEKVLNFLSENPNSWEINGENIVFNSESLSAQYDELINSL